MIFDPVHIFRSHGRQYIRDLREAKIPEGFRGRPVISGSISAEEARQAEALCPARALQANPCSLDLGRCLFCGECAFAFPGKISFTRDHYLAVNRREDLIIRAGADAPLTLAPGHIRKEIPTLFRHALKLRQVSAGGDNSAEMELNACGNVNFDMGRFGIEFVASPRHADGIVITGPITRNMSEALRICYEAVPAPKVVILAGTDAISGGLFAESRELSRGFLDQVPVDLFVPGNPPHPLTFINGILSMIQDT